MKTLVIGLTFLLGCPGPPTPVVVPLQQDGSIEEACSNLRLVGCSEGQPTKAGLSCFDHLTKLSKTVSVPAGCVSKAMSKEAIRLCGDENSTYFRCP